ncbi:MAG: MFS transporter [Alphaproteobacteria bacterium]|nr:MAG: MFS transporter [Alphaproteobacteria bacterium]
MSARSEVKERRPKAGHGAEQAERGSRIRERLFGLHTRSRRVISEHRDRRKLRDREVSDRSRRGLDWTNFFLADVQLSFGSFLAFYLADLGWSKQNVGLALTVGGLAAVAAQIPGGAVADAVRWKRALAASGFVLIAAAALILALWPDFSLVFVAEILHGSSAGLVGPAIAAISLGIAGRHAMSSRIGRNYRFAGAGNAVTAAFMGALGAYVSNHAIFIATAILCIPALAALTEIRANEIDYVRARNAAKRDHTFDLQRLVDLTKNWRLVLFAGALVLFHLCNASLLPLVGENLAHSKVANSALFMGGLIVVPQVVVAILAPWIGYWSELWGRKPLLLAGFAIETVRALLFALISDPLLMMAVQLLDGVTGAAITVLTILVITDLTTGTGRFNLAQGVLGTMRGIAAAIGTASIGTIVQHFGDFTGFLLMATGPALGAALIWAFLRETKPAKYID